LSISPSARIQKRIFLPDDYKINTWDTLKVYFDLLIDEKPLNVQEMKAWLAKASELGSVISEDMAWRYINMTRNTEDETYKSRYEDFVLNIQPYIAPLSDILNQKTLGLLEEFPVDGEEYQIMKKGLEKEVKVYRKENIELFTQIQIKQTEYQALMGGLNVEINGQEMTLPKASTYLLSLDRELREEVWIKINSAREKIKDKVNAVFDELLKLRHQVALNAGFKNFRDYMFVAMGRFDYNPIDCFQFHAAVEASIVDILNSQALLRKEKLGLETLKPWDTAVDINLKEALKPFLSGQELLIKAQKCFKAISPELEACLKTMEKMGHFDLESRKAKAPGGYNYPLEETGVPFIFMNAAGTLRDVVTMVHEGGHAVHSFAVNSLELSAFRNPTMEVAELASMAMELISMEHWEHFFTNPEELRRAKADHLSDIIGTLPWIMTIDKFQHWIYENPEHSHIERENKWEEILLQFSTPVVDWSGFEDFRKNMWHKQLHIFEVPFYYIEYGIAQLGAISTWKNYKENPKVGLEKYLAALKLGYTKPIADIYKTAGIRFDFSEEYIKDLVHFVKSELDKLQ
jgi:oligoendopeptidase F